MKLEELPDVLKVKELKDYLRMGQRQVYELVKQDDFPSFRLGRTIRVRKEDFANWLEENIEQVEVAS